MPHIRIPHSVFPLSIIVILLLALVGYVLFVIPSKESINEKSKLRVTASFYPLYYFATQIAGDKAEVINITPAGAEPHNYEPTARDIARIESSDLLILNGGNLEAWGDKIKDELTGRHTIIVIAGKGLVDRQLIEEGKAIQDPHVWLSLPLAKQEVEKIVQGFIQADPANASFYQSNAQSLKDKLDALDKEYREGLHSCVSRDIVTSHAAFGYLAHQYHLNQIAIAGVSPDEEPNTKKLAEISDLVKAKGIRVIFFENLINPKLSETIANETGAKALVLDPIEGISNNDIKAGKNYFTQMEANLHNLRIALQCQ
ncbi:MAG: zinc ABC transporter substrate-binding protein [Candidatus Dadabacteria bacterium]